jgi:phosphopantothenoylcysteine decarboxylase/phosphopantothenate--cysteine ligase
MKAPVFKTDTNKITIIDKALNKTTFSLKTKEKVALDICNKVVELIGE